VIAMGAQNISRRRNRLDRKFGIAAVTMKMMIIIIIYNFFAVALRPNAGHGLILEVSRSHTTTHHSR
jgi:hypothetical protein